MSSQILAQNPCDSCSDSATCYYYYWDFDGDGLPGGNYGNVCVTAGEEGNQMGTYNGQDENLVTCGSGGISNGTCSNTTILVLDIDDTCNGCNTTTACSENTEADLYDDCGTCNGLYRIVHCQQIV